MYKSSLSAILFRGLFIGNNPPPPPPRGQEISDNVIWGKNMKRGRETGENIKEKGSKGKETGSKGEENEKMVSKKVI